MGRRRIGRYGPTATHPPVLTAGSTSTVNGRTGSIPVVVHPCDRAVMRARHSDSDPVVMRLWLRAGESGNGQRRIAVWRRRRQPRVPVLWIPLLTPPCHQDGTKPRPGHSVPTIPRFTLALWRPPPLRVPKPDQVEVTSPGQGGYHPSRLTRPHRNSGCEAIDAHTRTSFLNFPHPFCPHYFQAVVVFTPHSCSRCLCFSFPAPVDCAPRFHWTKMPLTPCSHPWLLPSPSRPARARKTPSHAVPIIFTFTIGPGSMACTQYHNNQGARQSSNFAQTPWIQGTTPRIGNTKARNIASLIDSEVTDRRVRT